MAAKGRKAAQEFNIGDTDGKDLLTRLQEQLVTVTQMVTQNADAMRMLTERMNGSIPSSSANAAPSTSGYLPKADNPGSIFGPAAKDERKVRMIERKGAAKLTEYGGDQAQFELWAYKVRGYLTTEPGYRELFEWIDSVAMMEEKDDEMRLLKLQMSKQRQTDNKEETDMQEEVRKEMELQNRIYQQTSEQAANVEQRKL